MSPFRHWRLCRSGSTLWALGLGFGLLKVSEWWHVRMVGMDTCTPVIRQLPKMLILSHGLATIMKTGGHIGIHLTPLSSSSQNTFIFMFRSLTHFCSIKFYFDNPFFAFVEAAILKTGGHLGFSAGQRTFLRKYILDIICAKFGAFFTKWKILMKYWLNQLD